MSYNEDDPQKVGIETQAGLNEEEDQTLPLIGDENKALEELDQNESRPLKDEGGQTLSSNRNENGPLEIDLADPSELDQAGVEDQVVKVISNESDPPEDTGTDEIESLGLDELEDQIAQLFRDQIEALEEADITESKEITEQVDQTERLIQSLIDNLTFGPTDFQVLDEEEDQNERFTGTEIETIDGTGQMESQPLDDEVDEEVVATNTNKIEFREEEFGDADEKKDLFAKFNTSENDDTLKETDIPEDLDGEADQTIPVATNKNGNTEEDEFEVVDEADQTPLSIKNDADALEEDGPTESQGLDNDEDPPIEITLVLYDKLDEMTNELNKIKVALNESMQEGSPLEEIKLKCMKLLSELTGTKMEENSDGCEDSSGIAQSNSFRGILEEILFQANMKPAPFDNDARISGEDVMGNEKKKVICSGKDIRSITNEDEFKIISDEMDKFISSQPELVDGNSLKGKTLTAISESISEDESITVEIRNYLDFDLNEADFLCPSGGRMDMRSVIEAGTREVVTIGISVSDIVVSFSYRISNFPLNLVFRFRRNGPFDVALAPNNSLIENVMALSSANAIWLSWNILSDKGCPINTREENNLERKSMCILRSGAILARVESSKGIKKIASIDLAKFRNSTALYNQVRDVGSGRLVELNDGKNISGKTIPGILEYILDERGYVLEITNLLKVSLNEPLYYTENNMIPFRLPQVILERSREVVMVKLDCSCKERGVLVTFRIGATDLRIAIVGQLFKYGNKFAIAFVPNLAVADEKLMEFLTSDETWKTTPDHKFVMAKDGEQVIDSRNIIMKASMTEGMKAAIRVFIDTF